MSEALQTLLNRRSIRAYKEEQIKEEELQQILKSGTFAPSAMNQQPWHFTVIQNKELINKINEICKVNMQRNTNPSLDLFYNAPTLIIVSGDEKAIAPEIDSALALGNMFNAAEALNIGSCWIHAVRALINSEDGKKLVKELGIPDGYSIVASGVFGYKAANAASVPARKSDVVNIIK